MTFRPFWLDQALRSEHAAPCPPLAGDTRADVCIVGGGYRPVDRHHAQGARSRARRGAGRGRSLRRRRQRRQRRAVLVGQVLHPGTAVRTNRGDPPGQGLRGQHPGHRRLLPALRRRGRLPAGRHPLYRHQPGPGRQHRQRDRRSGAPRHQLLRQAPAGDVQRLAGSRRHLEGWFSPAAATVQPGKLVRGLRRVALQLGVRLYEGTPMRGLEHGRPAEVVTPRAGRRRPRGAGAERLDGEGLPCSSNAAWRSSPATCSSPSHDRTCCRRSA